ncbi:MAG: Na+:solute symporter [Cytophagales bacterium]|uniref:sodium:solute symporter family protein n=1 Tax=Cyclobacterium marinum TaxID=104 RepID=UPI0011EF6CDE|nr:sodium:solute symporter family protein [Cyclobacterium marinum]MBI0397306.1 Na+:solute symporter [Cyclobacterium marinum]MBR9776371.1 Na+:solute symporter [Cytophagales bacterium]|tara:strand:- start:60807 stop:62477 length:1671 start_codon:yes stop_codon:yes gene_type:complete
MHQLDYLTIFIFTLIILGAGLSFGRQGGDMKSFFAAGGAVPWSISGLSLFMSFFSAGTFVVWGSIAYEWGWVAITIQMAMCISGFLIGKYLAPKWKETQSITVAEYLTNRFGKKVQQYYTFIFLVLSLGYTGAFLYPVAKILNVVTGFDIYYAILLLGGMIMLYTAVGGLWAVIVTDVLQFVILTAAVLIVLPLSLEKVGGMNQFIAEAPDTFFNLFNGEYTFWFILAFVGYNTIFIGGNWAYVQRYTSVKDTKSASKVGYLFGALYLISPLIWMLPPMIYRVLDPSLTGLETEGAYLRMCMSVLPVGMLGLMLGGMIFATASSVNTSLNLAAAVLTNDVYQPLNPNAAPKTLMKVARIATLLFGLGTIGVAFMVPLAGGIVEVVLSIGAVTGGALYAPAIWGLFSKKQTGSSILVVTGLSLLINLFFKFISPALFSFALGRSSEMIVGVFLPIALLAFYEIFARGENVQFEQYKNYLGRNKDKDLTNGLNDGQSQNTYGYKVMGWAFIGIGLLFFGLGIWGGGGSIYLFIMGTLIFLLGYFAVHYSRKKAKAQNI